ncbi:Glycosyltransferase [Forsythia ovata]|uniref:Glycosyltransferase n=1 Tax=Forsythia ovata TaxID=205694 RepID=A0ABD1U9K9_9LAMI
MKERFGGGGKNQVGFNATELSQQMQPMPPMHGGASANTTESRPSPSGSNHTKAPRLFRPLTIISREQGNNKLVYHEYSNLFHRDCKEELGSQKPIFDQPQKNLILNSTADMGSMETAKPHVVLVPYPAQGHVTPMMRLAKLLHSRGFYITFVNTEFNHRRLIRSKGPDSVKGLPDFKFETIPDGMPPSDEDATQEVPLLCDTTRKTCLLPFKALLSRLNSLPDAPPVTCIISDGVMSFAIRAAEDMGIPEVQFWTASACSFIGYLHYRELLKRGICPFKSK